MARSRRITALLNTKLDAKLAAYMAAASAAGVALIAATPSAEAKVVYTPANIQIHGSGSLDLNNDGVADFVFGFHELDKSVMLAVGPAVAGNEIRIAKNGEAAAGFLGVPVGGGEKFAATNSYSWGLDMAIDGGYSTTNCAGNWANVTNRYLGFKFLIDGQVHYGWARMSVTDNLANVVITGYAYETIPGKTIIEGHTSETDVAEDAVLPAPTERLATLGALARGSR
jgi:hypothetical protein